MWSESDSVPTLSLQGAPCSSVLCLYGRESLLSQGEEYGESEMVEESPEYLQWRASKER